MSKRINIKSESRENVKLFICNHPMQISLYKNLSDIIKRYDQKVKIIFVKINHQYFEKFDFKMYEKCFDYIINLKFINYQRNLFSGFWDAIKYKNRIKKEIGRVLDHYENVDIFLSGSAWLPVNVIQSMLIKRKNIRNIIRFCGGDLENSENRTKRTLLCELYSICFRCYMVKSIYSPEGRFLDYIYLDTLPGLNVKVVNTQEYNRQMVNSNDGLKIMPFPLVRQREKKTKRDMVIIFGDDNIYGHFREYLPDYATYVKKIKSLFKGVGEKYYECQLYYKPHPFDKGKIMPGVDLNIFKLFGNEYDASGVFDTYSDRIKAVYSTFASSSSYIASRYGIPSYRFYKYFCVRNPSHFTKSEYIFDISSLDQIGIIDNEELINNTKVDIEQLWRPILNV